MERFNSNAKDVQRKICVKSKSFLPSPIVSESASEDRKGIKLNLTPGAHAIISDVKATTGIQQQSALTKILEWFASQPDDVRLAILVGNQDPGEMLARKKMADLALAGKDVESLSVEQAAELVRLGLNRLELMGKEYRRQLTGGKPKK